MSNIEKCRKSGSTKHEKCELVGRKITEDLFGEYYDISFTIDQFNRIDFNAVAKGDESEGYTGEIKCYRNPQYPRNHNKFNNYQIDYDKLVEIVNRSILQITTPVLVAHFTDLTMIWDLNKSRWRGTQKKKKCQGDGQNPNRGEDAKREKVEGYLQFEDACYIRDNSTGMVFTNYQDWKSWMEYKKAS